jgi:hypothetical protein
VSAIHIGDGQRLIFQVRFDEAVRQVERPRASSIPLFVDFASIRDRELNAMFRIGCVS